MVSADDLQKRVETLQRQLRKAGDHLKRLATENDTLVEQVERLTETEAKLKTTQQELEAKNAQDAEQLAECKQQLSTVQNERDQAVATGKQQAAKIEELEQEAAAAAKARNDSDDGSGSQWKAAMLELASGLGVTATINTTSDGDARVEELTEQISKLQIEAQAKKELEDKVRIQAGVEAAVVLALETFATAEQVPETVPAAIRSEIERIRSEHTKQADELRQQLEESKSELEEATEAREELSRDYDELLERIGKMKDGLKAKMSADSEQVKRLRAELSQASAATKASETKTKQLEESLQLAASQLDATKRALWDSQETAERASSELSAATEQASRVAAELGGKVAAAEARMAAEAEERAQLEERVEQLQTELNQALNAEGQWADERDVHMQTITNLQGALEDLQATRDAEVDLAVEKLREELRLGSQQVRTASARAEQAEQRLRRIEVSGATAEQWQHKLGSQAAEIEKLRHETVVLKEHLDESMRRLREESNDFNLDKRVITNLVVGFLALPYGDSKRYEILQLMSSMLQFSEEQQEKVGLIRKAGRRAPLAGSSSASPAPPSPADGVAETKDSFSDQWISFLLRESSRARSKHT
ncbi:hypothetical protein FBU59_000666 [Linderina macrospora]|uniref:Uncharacterized protein n=1 Tax=Linderina macrospora TaxID=4868 RepID=A0ACC1JGJ6_9FUNG|nr:hypothetical protein FBU59_000666 [Linderina macrospora]